MTIFLLGCRDGSLAEFTRNVTPRSIRTDKFIQNVEFVILGMNQYRFSLHYGVRREVQNLIVPKRPKISFEAPITLYLHKAQNLKNDLGIKFPLFFGSIFFQIF